MGSIIEPLISLGIGSKTRGETVQFINADVCINQTRPLKIIQIGAGLTGIQMCHKVQELQNVDFKIYEKNSGLGGTWFENTYPGCACDIPAHAYQFVWAPNPEWSRLIVTAPELLEYMRNVAAKHDFLKYMSFQSRITGARWSEIDAKWTVEVEKQTEEGLETLHDTCDVLISGTGILNVWKLPAIKGIEKYKGKLMHTATWDNSYVLEGKRVAVLGSGASGLQVTPELQKSYVSLLHYLNITNKTTEVKSLDVYIRSPTWLLGDPWKPIEAAGAQKVYTQEEIERFKSDPVHFLKYRKAIEAQVNRTWPMFYKNSKFQQMAKGMALQHYEVAIKDPALRKYLTPGFEVGCRRPTSGDVFLNAIQQPNVTVLKEGVNEMKEGGIITKDGTLKEYDAIICATGFDTTFTPRFPVHGRRGHELQNDFGTSPEAYMGLAVHGYPNYFVFSGPISPVGNGSAYPGAAMTSEYIIKFLKKVQTGGIRTFEVKQKPQDDFNAWVQSKMPNMVWTGSCDSWYKNRKTGKVQVTWPGSMLHYAKAMKDVHFEHFDLEYLSENQFDWLGNGMTSEEIFNPEADMAPYIT